MAWAGIPGQFARWRFGDLVTTDLEQLFHGHGVASDEPWFVQAIEPNLAGATAIAEHWYSLLT